MTCIDIASGVRVGISVVEEAVCGEVPAGLGAFTAVAITVSAGIGTLTRAGGSFVDDGYLVGQMAKILGSSNPATNGYWRILTVTALVVTIADPDAEIVAEPSGATVAVALEGLALTSRNVNLERDTLESERVSPDRQYHSVRHGLNRVTGDIGYELALVSTDTAIRGAMFSEWSTPVITTTGALTFTDPNLTDNLATITRASGSWITDGVRPGDVLKLTGATPSTNNKFWLVISVSSATQIVVANPGNEVVTGGSGGTMSYPGRRIDIGTTKHTYSMCRSFTDVAKYQYFHQCIFNTMSMTLSPENPVGGSFEILGTSAEAMANVPMGTEDPSPEPSTEFFAAFDGYMYEAGELNAVVTSIDYTLDNQATLTGVVGSKFSPNVFEARASVEGTISAMFTGGGMYDRFFNEEETAMSVYMESPDASGFICVTMPRIKYTGSTMDPPAEGPVVQEMPFRALAKSMNNGGGNEVITSLTIQISNAVSDERSL
jgi:hypothetical protein